MLEYEIAHAKMKSIITLFNHLGLSSVEIFVRHRWVEEAAAAQNYIYVWVIENKPQ